MSSKKRSRHSSCLKVLAIHSTTFQCPTLHAHAFHLLQIRHPSTHTPSSQDRRTKHFTTRLDAIDRRSFLSNAIAASSALATLSLQPTTIQPAQATETTPSPIERIERELAASPDRTNSKLPDPRYFFAGGASAALSHGLATPIDVVKTRRQTDATPSKGASPIETAWSIVREEGGGGLTVGLGPTVVGYGLEGACKFGVYESLKPVCLAWVGGGAYFVAAVAAGAVASVVLCPMEEVRIRLVTDPSLGGGFVEGLGRIFEEEGLGMSFRRGMLPMLAKQVPYTMGKQVSFDFFAGMLYLLWGKMSSVSTQDIDLEVEIGAAFLASIVACLMSHPGDVLLTATYKDRAGLNDKCFGATIRQVYRDGGIPAFFRGLDARFLHVGCIITLQLVIYDQIKQALGLPASGS